MKKYQVTLAAEERQQLQATIAAVKAAAKTLAHARILLKADQAEGGPAWPDHRIAEALEVSVDTVERVRQRLVEHGLDAALRRKEQDRASRERVLDGRAEARLVAWPARPRRRAARCGRSGSWPTDWSSWRWSRPSLPKRSARL